MKTKYNGHGHADNLDVTKYYRTLDPLENLRIKVCLKKVADRHVPFSSGPTFSILETDTKALAANSLLPAPIEETIRWQKKIFSPKEIIDSHKNPDSSGRRSHWRILNSLLKNSKSKESKILKNPESIEGKSYLFTYVEDDDYFDEENYCRHITNAKVEPLSRLARRILELDSKATNVKNDKKKVHRHEKVGLEKILSEFTYKRMHIMAYLYYEKVDNNKNISLRQFFEKRLCTIRYYDQGIMALTPGLTKKGSVYQFEIFEDVYQFTLENVSKALEVIDEEKEWKIYNEYYLKRSAARAAELPDNFTSIPEAYGLSLTILGDIVSARNFKGQNLYIHYLLELSDGWTSNKLDLLSAYTQCSSCTFDEELEMWEARFAFPLEMQLIAPHYQVCSMDSWDRHVVEGYGYASIPAAPASPSAEMRSVFIGGSSELEDITYGAVPVGHR
ncbi:Pleiotropic negative transcriptional regulator, partial [Blyttiomyces sp. JEL0837]